MGPIKQTKCYWEEFVEKNKSIDKNYIVRGHTNENQSGEFIEWKLISSFNRFHSDLNFRFEGFLGQQLEENIFKSTYGNYECVRINKLQDSDTLTKVYFLQHYGVPSCLIDFTYNPLIALYFAISNIKGQAAGSYNSLGEAAFYPENFFLSVYKLNIKLLKTIYNYKIAVFNHCKIFENIINNLV